ncbi:hypothetical protein RMD16_25725 [Pseudomonas aeruginosa]|uniref:hypothetical protein n=1 Tax=Pseudomonas aeruginosa TaxID=287 RepID=UPI00287E73BF|nr:hypothetical protein [Pseudomonas aeruginosa]MDS9486660.1 hypothetical protein [Pseudomonas aeruginosa]MDS9540542.1 hypothetical protein [Pseudomonas aeruginosa]MDS9553587.1 hypothetical protein [Pseudomonas aeruginosa]MDS9559603.1 hypothetical protein [Pseudomonas aeruginosa]MDS9632699.1 hypothetical protein [Pseudomonas aeruginosa]
MLMLNGQDVRVCEARLRQARAQLEVPSTFDMVEATQVVELYTSFGVVQVPLPAGEFIVGMEDPAGVRRFGVVRFEGIPDDEGWHVD